MGSIKNFDLSKFINVFNTNIFIETGLGWGHGVQFASSFNFKKLYSIEISKEVIDKYNETYPANSRIEILLNNSAEALKNLLPKITDNCLIFLDAHLPSFDVLGVPIDNEQNEDLRLPLLNELKIIKELRTDKNFKDCIIIDDLSFYSEEDIFPDSKLRKTFNIHPKNKEHINCLNNIMSYFDNTHRFQLIKEHSGYGIFLPK